MGNKQGTPSASPSVTPTAKPSASPSVTPAVPAEKPMNVDKTFNEALAIYNKEMNKIKEAGETRAYNNASNKQLENATNLFYQCYLKKHLGATFYFGKLLVYFGNNGIKIDLKPFASNWIHQDDMALKGSKMVTRSAEDGYPEAQYYEGLRWAALLPGSKMRPNMEEAIKWWVKAANQNHAEAKARLGNYYFDGTYVPKDTKMAYNLYKDAADQGNADGYYGLYMYYTSVKPNMQKALRYLEKAANGYHTEAQYLLGNYYYKGERLENGTVVKQNMQKGSELIFKAARKGHKKAGQLYNQYNKEQRLSSGTNKIGGSRRRTRSSKTRRSKI